MPDSKRRKPGRPSAGDGGKTRAALLRAARDLFSETGFEGVSIRRVADRVGVTPAVVYYYFDNKRTLYGEMLEEAADTLLESMRRALLPENATAEQRIGAFFDAVMQTMVANPWLPRVVLRDALSTRGETRRLFIERFAEPGARGLSVPWIEAEVQAGRMRADVDPDLAAISLMGLAVWPFVAGPIVREVFGMTIDAATAERFAVHNTRLFGHGTLTRGHDAGEDEHS